MKSSLIDMLLALIVAIPAGALLLLIVAFYLHEAVRKQWGWR